MLKVAYVTPGGTVHDERWLKKLREHFDVRTELDNGVDIVQTGPVGDWPLGLVPYVRESGAKLVLMSWGFDVLENEITPSMQESIDHADMFLCDSDVVREKLLSLRMPPPPPVVQIPWGVDLEMFKPKDRRIYRACMFGDMRKKDIGTLDVAMGIACQIIRGELGLIRPEIAVPYNDMPWLYSRLDAYICASPSDGTSVSLLEAMACGLPVIVADAPGNREWVTQGVNGWLCEIGNAQSFADAIVECARMTPAERRDMGQRNRAVVEARADWDKNFGRVVDGYLRLAAK